MTLGSIILAVWSKTSVHFFFAHPLFYLGALTFWDKLSCSMVKLHFQHLIPFRKCSLIFLIYATSRKKVFLCCLHHSTITDYFGLLRADIVITLTYHWLYTMDFVELRAGQSFSLLWAGQSFSLLWAGQSPCIMGLS